MPNIDYNSVLNKFTAFCERIQFGAVVFHAESSIDW